MLSVKMKDSKLEFGMPTLIELDNLNQNIELSNRLKLDFIELNMNLPEYQLDKLQDTLRYREIMDKYGIYFTIHLDENLNIADFNSLVADAYIETVKRTIDVAHKLDVPILNMHMNHGVHFTLPDRKVQLYKKYNEEYMKSFERFRLMCESQIGNSDIKICIENTNGFRDYEKSAIEYLLESSVFGLTWDIGHSNSVENIDEEFIMKHENRLKHFHIHDSIGRKDHMVLGTGEVDIKQRLDIAQKYSCRCVIETKTVDALIESVSDKRITVYR